MDGTQMLAGSEQYNMYIIKGTKSGYTDDDDLDLEFVGGGHSGGRTRGTDDWDEEEWWFRPKCAALPHLRCLFLFLVVLLQFSWHLAKLSAEF